MAPWTRGLTQHIILHFQMYSPPHIWYYPNVCGFVDSKELVSMHDTSLNRGNLASFQEDSWIGNHVNISISPLLCNIFNLIFMQHLVISGSEYCLHINHFLSQVVDAYCRMLQFDDISRTKLFLLPYIVVMKGFDGHYNSMICCYNMSRSFPTLSSLNFFHIICRKWSCVPTPNI